MRGYIGVLKWWQIGLLYGAAMVVFFMYRSELAHWLQHSRPPAALAWLLAVGLIVFPVIPFKLAIGALGYLYGPLAGAALSWSAATLASTLIYLFTKARFGEQGSAWLARFQTMERMRVLFEKRPFLAIFAARLIPLFPQGIVNIYPAFLSVGVVTYTVASALGKIPAMLLFAYAGSTFATDPGRLALFAGVYALFALAVYIVYRLWLRRPA